jgi:YfiH family protein
MASLRQIHSADVLAAPEEGCAGDGDALITTQPGLAVSIRTADCLPILLADPRCGVVAAVHAGWRGTAARIVAAAVTRMCEQHECDVAAIYAAIGPGIGECCYQVGPEVAREFGREGTVHLDLAAANREQLLEAGVLAAHIDTLALCTRCRADLFHSWRRDGPAAGRMVSYIRVCAR